ncbi:hypothetical protein MPSEU_000200600 [Mayamaea pseudoterrestris]|nr:hypothetical protein MPSEU_000200600 [Mayamaea pseudoterrestris]
MMLYLYVLLFSFCLADAFQFGRGLISTSFQHARRITQTPADKAMLIHGKHSFSTALYAADNDSPETMSVRESDQILLGGAGVLAAAIVLYSEYTLKSTGCGLPAGPAGLFGAAEGVSYLLVVGLAGYSLLKKFMTGAGLPAGPGGILGAAEGLSFLAIAVGLVVLGFQLADYGYVPNAVPMEGGMCS